MFENQSCTKMAAVFLILSPLMKLALTEKQLQRYISAKAADGYGWDGLHPSCRPPVALTFSEV